MEKREFDCSRVRVRVFFVCVRTAHKSGRHTCPCSTRPIVAGNDPPPCANATDNHNQYQLLYLSLSYFAPFKFGYLSKIPPKIMEQMARLDSAGIPTSHGSQYYTQTIPLNFSLTLSLTALYTFSISPFPIMSQGWTKIDAPSLSAV